MSPAYLFIALLLPVAASRRDLVDEHMFLELELHSMVTQYMENSTVSENAASQSPVLPPSNKADKATINAFPSASLLEDDVHPLIALPAVAGSILTVYNGLSDLREIINNVGQMRTVYKIELGSDLMSILDSLVTVHDTLVSKLRVSPAEWNETCTNCRTPESLEDFFTIHHPFSTGALASDHSSCIRDIKAKIAQMRDSIVMVDEVADAFIQSYVSDPNVSMLSSFTRYENRGCDGDCQGEGCDDLAAGKLMAQQLSSPAFHSSVPDVQSGLCRELPAEMDRADVSKACSVKCAEIEQCKGFTLYDGTITNFREKNESDTMAVGDEVGVWENERWESFKRCGGIEVVLASNTPGRCEVDKLPLECGQLFLGCFAQDSVWLEAKRTSSFVLQNRCCFRTSIVNEYTQESTECFLKPPPNQLRSKNSASVAEWLQKHSKSVDKSLAADLKLASKRVLARSLNGMALQAMGSVKLKQYLGISDESNLRRLQCMIDASEGDKDPKPCSDSTFMEFWGRVHNVVDPIVFWGVKIETGISWWLLQSVNRIVTSTASYLRQYQWISESTHNRAKAYVEGTALVNDIWIGLGKVSDLGKQALALQMASVETYDPLVLASAVIWLVKQATAKTWDQCWMAQDWLSKTDVLDSEKLEEVVNTAFRDIGD